MTAAELEELREMWHAAVVHGNWKLRRFEQKPQPCWFEGGAATSDPRAAGPCEGRIEGAHWIKRQAVAKWMVRQLGLPEKVISPSWRRRYSEFPGEYVGDGELADDLELLFLAEWDPRNGVPACKRHHTIFDSQRVPLPSEQIVVWRHQVPAHVEAFALDWGLEHELDRKHDSIGGGI